MAAVLRYCIVAFVCAQVAAMEKLQKMYFISMKADDKTSQCNVDVRMMSLLRVFFSFFFWFLIWVVFIGRLYMVCVS